MAETKFTYEVIDKEKKTIRIKQALSVTDNVVIPEKVTYYKSEYTVTEIGDKAFFTQSIKGVTIPNSVTRIGEYAFSGCGSLTSINIPESVKKIGSWAFACTALKNVNIPSGINLGLNPFEFCKVLESVVFNGPSSSGCFFQYFHGCKNLKTVVLPHNITCISSCAFEDCSNLFRISIPQGVKEIGFRAFSGCTMLGRVTIPEGVKKIEFHTFYNCRYLSKVEFPKSLIEIGPAAFEGCSSLKSIDIPNSVKSISKDAFKDCPAKISKLQMMRLGLLKVFKAK